MDLTARREMLTHVRGQPTLMQVPLVPAYALTVREHINESQDKKLCDGFPSQYSLICFATHTHYLVFSAPSRKQQSDILVHKTQALSIPHTVLGSLEGVFALGQVCDSICWKGCAKAHHISPSCARIDKLPLDPIHTSRSPHPHNRNPVLLLVFPSVIRHA